MFNLPKKKDGCQIHEKWNEIQNECNSLQTKIGTKLF